MLLLCTCFAIYIRRRKAQNRAHHPQVFELIVDEPLCRHSSLRLGKRHTHTEAPHNSLCVESSAPGSKTLPLGLNTHPDYDTLVREMRRMREVRVLRANRMMAHGPPDSNLATAGASFIDGGVEAEIRGDIAVLKQEIQVLRANRTVAHGTPDLTHVTTRAPFIQSDAEAELRGEMAVLRAELTRLQAETEGLRDLPPAYH